MVVERLRMFKPTVSFHAMFYNKNGFLLPQYSAARVHYVDMLSQTSSSNFILLMGLCHTPYGGLGAVRRGSARLDVMYYVTSAPIAFLISFHEARLDVMYDARHRDVH